MKVTMVAALLAGATLAVPAYADTLLQQINGSYADDSVTVSQNFPSDEADTGDQYDTITIDDVSIGGSTTLTSVQAGVGTFNGGTVSGITGFTFNVYSSLAAAGANLTGDVASVSFAPGAVTLDPGAFDAPESALLTIDLSSAGITLASGTYFFGVIMDNSFDANGEVGILANGTGTTAYQANPANGFGQGTTFATNAGSAAYNLFGNAAGDTGAVPEPASWAMMIAGFGLVGGALRASRRTVAFAA